MIFDEANFSPGGDRYITVEFGNEMNLELNFMAQGLAGALRDAGWRVAAAFHADKPPADPQGFSDSGMLGDEDGADALHARWPEGCDFLVVDDYALDADRAIDRRFWLGSVAEHIRRQPVSSHAALLRVVSRRIHVTFAIPVRERQAAVRFLCSRVIPISSGVRLDG